MKRLYIFIAAAIVMLSACVKIDTENKLDIEESSFVAGSLGMTREELETELGAPDSIFEGYEVYFDRGVSVRYSEVPEVEDNGWKGHHIIRTGKAENMVFDQRSDEEVLTGISTGAKSSAVRDLLGEPDFDDKDVFGYKRESFYIFFVGSDYVEEISVYPKEAGYDASVVDRAAKLCEGREYSRELAQELAALFEENWPDYNYSYDIVDYARYSDRAYSLGLAYFSRGVEIRHSRGEDGPILKLYANYEGKRPNGITDPDGHKLIELVGDDLVFEQEKLRLEDRRTLADRLKNEAEISPDGSKALIDNLDGDGIDVISVNGDFPNYCISTSPLQYGAGLWLSDRYFVYSFGKGQIMVYDLELDRETQISTTFSEILSVYDGRIELKTYPDDSVEYTVEYEFDENGEIVLHGDGDYEWR